MEENEIEQNQHQILEEGANAPNTKYEDGKVLPKELRARLLQEAKPCVPIKEIDPYFSDQHTFIVIGSFGTIHRFSSPPGGCGTLNANNPLRKISVYLLTNWIFSTFIVATLLLNCVALLETQGHEILKDLGGAPKRGWVLDAMYIVNYVCLVIFCFELFLKVLARGLVGGGFSCLRDPWTWLDLVVIWTGFFPYYVFILHKKAAVWIRVFKIIPLIPSVRAAGKVFVKAVKNLGGMLILLALIFWFFALLGSQMYMGSLTQRCIKRMPEHSIGDYDTWYRYWDTWNANFTNWYSDDFGYAHCGNASGARQCPEGFVCLQGYDGNPDGGYTNFDNVLWSALSVIRIASEDFTEEIFRQVLETNGPWHIIFFIAIFFLITYPMGCLFFAILGNLFVEESEAPAELEMEELTALADVLDFDNCSQNPESLEVKGKKLSTSENLVGFRKSFHAFIFHDYVRNALIGIILIDILGIISDYHGMEQNLLHCWLSLVIIPYSVFLLYLTEFTLKLFALGPAKYFTNRWNQLDIVVLLTFVLECLSYFGSYNGYLLAPIRMLKLIQYWPSLRMIVAVYYKAIKALWGWIVCGLIVFAFIVLIGPFELGQHEMERYRGRTLPKDFHRWSFIDFWHSFRVVVRMQIAEWVETFWDVHPYAGATTFVYYLVANTCGAVLISFVLIGVVHSTINELQSNYDPSKQRGLHLMLRKACSLLSSPIKRIQPRELTTKEDITEHWAYKVCTCVLIISASSAMIFENNRASEGLQTGLFVVEIMFTVAFAIITVFELVYFGFKEAITNRGWLVDTVIVLENILNLSYYQFSVSGQFLLGMCCIRSFRPLMLVSRVPWLKAAFRGLKQEVKSMWETILAIMFIWLVFDAFGVHWLQGLYYQCTDPMTAEEVFLHKQECLSNNYTWENSAFNFDNAGDGFVNMVFLASRMGWVSIINDGSDAVGVDMARQRDVTKFWLFYFITFIFVGGIGALGILFSYVFNKFQEDKGYSLILTKEQATVYSDAKNSEQPKQYHVSLEQDFVPLPDSPCRRAIYKFVTNPTFDVAVMSLIIIDNVCLSMEHYNMHVNIEIFMVYVRFVILLLYTVEMVLKMVGWGKHYFKSGWNYLDMIVVVTGIVEHLLLEFVATNFISSGFFRVLRVFRLFRFLMAEKCGSQTVKVVISSVVNVRHALGNLLLLHMTNMWAFGLLGTYLFSNVMRNGVLNDVINFESFQSTLWTLILLLGFPCLDGLYFSLSHEFGCNVEDLKTETHTCGDKASAILYIGSYAALTFLVLLNMYAVLISEIISEIGRAKKQSKTNDVPLENVSSERPNNREISELG